MDIFEKVKTMEINKGVELCRNTKNAVLLDVRSSEEYSQGHIEGSINVPTMGIPSIGKTIPDKDTPIFTYCLSGARSRRAAGLLITLGYTDVTNIGGITDYKGK